MEPMKEYYETKEKERSLWDTGCELRSTQRGDQEISLSLQDLNAEGRHIRNRAVKRNVT